MRLIENAWNIFPIKNDEPKILCAYQLVWTINDSDKEDFWCTRCLKYCIGTNTPGESFLAHYHKAKPHFKKIKPNSWHSWTPEKGIDFNSNNLKQRPSISNLFQVSVLVTPGMRIILVMFCRWTWHTSQTLNATSSFIVVKSFFSRKVWRTEVTHEERWHAIWIRHAFLI